MMTYGVIFLAIGLVLFTTGGLIAMARNPKAFDHDVQASLGLTGKNLPKNARTALDRVMLHDPKAKWFTRIGFALFLVGMAIIAWSSQSSPDADAIDRVGVTKQIKTN